jgi:hypothetical protein
LEENQSEPEKRTLKTMLNPNPSAEQLAPNEYVDRIRRIPLNDLENLPFFLVAEFLFILTEPSLMTPSGCCMAMSFRGSCISPPISPPGLAPHAQRSGLWVL